MIAIINRGPETDDPMGERSYTVGINNEVIATFKHTRRDGLATCLRKAADAVELEEQARVTDLLKRVHGQHD